MDTDSPTMNNLQSLLARQPASLTTPAATSMHPAVTGHLFQLLDQIRRYKISIRPPGIIQLALLAE